LFNNAFRHSERSEESRPFPFVSLRVKVTK